MLKTKYIYSAIILYFITAYYSVGHNSPDEYYQILEFAAYKLGLGDAKFLTWEYYDQIRPAWQIWFAVFVYKSLAYVSVTNPFTVAFILRLFSAFISLVGVLLFIQAFLPSIRHDSCRKWFILLSLFSWLIVYNSVRYSSENVSEKIFLLGFSLLFLPKLNRSFIICFIIGLLFGFSFEVRFQNLILVVAVYVWLLLINNFTVIGGANNRVINFPRMVVISLGLIFAIIIGCIIDKWFYGNWVFTPWNYLNLNLLQGKAASFGHEPWYFYSLIVFLLPYGPLYLVSTITSIKDKFYNPIIWMVVLYVLIHSFISHKELRFLVPVLCFMPLLMAYFFDALLSKQFLVIGKKWYVLWHWLWYFNCFIVLLVAVVPSGTHVLLCKEIYNRFSQPLKFYAITEGGNELNFYKRSNVELIYIKDVNQVQCDKNKECLLALTCQQIKENPNINGRIVYNNCPNWLLKLNFNGWLDRTAVYNVYQLNK